MPVDTLEYKGERYPAYQATGNAARFVLPFAREVCRGEGFDVGCGRREWAFPLAIPVDLSLGENWTATNLPIHPAQPDFIFSSHLLEHLPDWVGTLDYWRERLKPGGVLFLYLPHYSQGYWRPWNNRKHRNVIEPGQIRDYLTDRGYRNVFVSGVDLNHSFAAMGEKGCP